MSTITEARQALADAVTAVGIDCEPYPPDSITPPAAWVAGVAVDFAAGAGFSFCESGLASASIVAVKERNDRAGATQNLEDKIAPVNSGNTASGGVRVVDVQSGATEIAGQSLPAVTWSLEFAIAME